MTINIADNTPRKSYTVTAGNTSTSFDTEFEFFAEADLNVYVDGVKKTLSADYTVSGGNGSTGTVAISVTGASGNSTVVLTRSIALERTTDFPSQGAFQITSLNTELDRITAIQADLDDETQRSLRLADDDASVAMTLPLKATRVGTVLGFNATTGAPEAGPTIANVNSLSAITANINTVGGIAANVTTVAGIASNVTTVAGIAGNVTSVAGNASNINSAVSNASNINTVAGKASEITSVAAKASLITSDFVSDLNTLAVTDVINDINTLATSDIVSDLNTLATTDIVSDLNTLATTDIVSDINTLATSDIVTDLNLLATSDFVSDLNTLATSGNVTAVNNVSGSIANVNTVASNLASVNSFGETYRVSANAPTTSLDAGDLWFDTTNNLMKVYSASGFINAGSSVNGTANRFAWTVGTSSGSYDGSLTVFPATYDAGFVDVFLNGVKLLVGTDVTATNGTSVTLASAAVAADIVEIVAYGTFTAATELSLADNKKISLGTGQDLELTWDGTDGHISVAGTLNIDGSGETLAKFIDDGAVELYHNNAVKLATTSTGVDVTGDIRGILASGTGGDTVISAISGVSNGYQISVDASNNQTYKWFNGGTQSMTLNSSGNVGIGTASPTKKVSASIGLNDTDGYVLEYSGDAKGGILLNPVAGEVRMGALNSSGTYFTTVYSNNSEAMRIDSSGNVGIDFTPKTMHANITSSLNVGSGTVFQRTKDTYLASNTYYNASDAGTSISTGYGLAYYQSVTNGAHQWFTSAASAGSADAAHSFSIPMTLDSTGGLRVGTTNHIFNSPQYEQFSVKNAGVGNACTFSSSDVTGGFPILYVHTSDTTSSQSAIIFQRHASAAGSITTTNTSVAYNTSSDYRLKTAVTYDWDATSRLKQLKPARFKWIVDGDDAVEVDGFLAHEAATVVPEAVSGTKDETRDVENAVLSSEGVILHRGIAEADWTAGKLATTDDDGNTVDALYPSDSTWAASHTEDVMQGIDQAKLVPLLCKTILELEARITALEAE